MHWNFLKYLGYTAPDLASPDYGVKTAREGSMVGFHVSRVTDLSSATQNPLRKIYTVTNRRVV